MTDLALYLLYCNELYCAFVKQCIILNQSNNGREIIVWTWEFLRSFLWRRLPCSKYNASMGRACVYRNEIQMLSEFYADTEVASCGPCWNMIRSGGPLTAAPLSLLLNCRLLQTPDHCQRSVKGENNLL